MPDPGIQHPRKPHALKCLSRVRQKALCVRSSAISSRAKPCTVVVAARREDQSQRVVQQSKVLGADGLFLKTDVTQRAEIAALAEHMVATFGHLDCAVNNAGITGPLMVPLAEIEEDAWDACLNTNLKAMWLCMKYEIRAMLQHGQGAIITSASIYGFKSVAIGAAPYCASKFGPLNLSQFVARQI